MNKFGELRYCTWKNCTNRAVHKLFDRDGNEWADLCHGHHREFEEAFNSSIQSLNPKQLLRVWVLAQGGAEKAAKSIDTRPLVNLLRTIQNKDKKFSEIFK